MEIDPDILGHVRSQALECLRLYRRFLKEFGDPNSPVTLAERILYFADDSSPYFATGSVDDRNHTDEDAAVALDVTLFWEHDLRSIVDSDFPRQLWRIEKWLGDGMPEPPWVFGGGA